MDKLIIRIKSIIEKSAKFEIEERVIPPDMELRLKETSAFILGVGSGGVESLVFKGKDFSEAYGLLSHAVVDGSAVIERNIVEPDLGYLKGYCGEFLKKLQQ